MNVGSTFSGVGGIDLGLERAGMCVVWNAEQDEWCRGVLRHHWPDAEQYADVRDVARRADDVQLAGRGDGPGPLVDRRQAGSSTRAERDEDARGVDVLCGGFPCQDLSVAGKRAGLAGARSGLFHEFARIADALRPEWLLIENVPGLLSSNDGRDFGVVLHTLAELGYGVAWRVLDSRYFGVPQRRRRVFIVGRAGGDHASALRALCESCDGSPPAGECSWQGAPTRPGGRVAASLSKGSAASPGVNPPGRRQEDDVNLVQVSTLQGAPGRGYRIDSEAAAGGHLQPVAAGVRRLTPRECERLQSWPDDWTLVPGMKCPDSRRYAACGNGVTSNVAEWIGRRIVAIDSTSGASAPSRPQAEETTCPRSPS